MVDGGKVRWNESLLESSEVYAVWYSRLGNAVKILLELRNKMPTYFLDGELWTGRGTFKELMPIFNVKIRSDTFVWSYLRFAVFDLASPYLKEKGVEFEARYAHLLCGVNTNHSFIIPSLRLRTMDRAHVDSYFKEVIDEGGEGLVLRKPRSPYESGRSHSVLKLKTMRDGEALIDDVQLGSFRCRLPDGNLFLAKSPPQNENVKKGDVITYKCVSVSSTGVPRQAVILRKRLDMSWNDVLANNRA